MVLVFSSHANDPRQVKREVQIAFEEDVIVIPFRIHDITPSRKLQYYMQEVPPLDALIPPRGNPFGDSGAESPAPVDAGGRPAAGGGQDVADSPEAAPPHRVGCTSCR